MIHKLKILGLEGMPSACCSCGWGFVTSLRPSENETHARAYVNAAFTEHLEPFLKNFFVTFGQKFRVEAHPQNGHPDGWIRIRAQNIHEAEDRATREFGPLWVNVYREPDFDKPLYPKGEIKCLT